MMLNHVAEYGHLNLVTINMFTAKKYFECHLDAKNFVLLSPG